ncbi:MAG: glycosyltransferase family 4 protein [Candidatus Niyogibacteria bacterium]|nr:glycosyltransferase family 4 protein [Candidatus Niyogibacteria bacterium]
MQRTSTKKILHITPHFGAGVGAVILPYLSKMRNNPLAIHRVVCLDYANHHALVVAKEAGFALHDNMSKKKSEILGLIAASDIVLVHWWNHPLLYDFLVREKLPPSRIIFWSHISGFPPPNNFTAKALMYPDVFVFTTPLSREVAEVERLSDERKKYLRYVWSTGGVDRVLSIERNKHSGFIVGYIGNVDYAKMHPDFLDICDKVRIPNVKFVVVGGPNGALFQGEAERRGIGNKFHFTGFVSEEEKWGHLATFDIFGYPLAPHHYGSCDQVLQEVMAAGVVPVVLSNPMERYMVEDGITGVVAKNTDEYADALQNLYHNAQLRDVLSKNAKQYAMQTFSLEKMAQEWEVILDEVMNIPKTVKKWDINKKSEDITPKDIFLEALGSHGEVFTAYCDAKNDREREVAAEKIKEVAVSANWKSKTKGTVHQYSSFFPDDALLSLWSALMK